MTKVALYLSIICIVGFSYAAEESPSYQLQYPITSKVLQAFFSSPKKEITAAGASVIIDDVTITLEANAENNEQVNLQVEVHPRSSEDYAPWQQDRSLNFKIQKAHIDAVVKNSTLSDQVTFSIEVVKNQLGLSVDKAALLSVFEKKVWIDDAMGCKVNHNAHLSCSISAPREMFEAIKKATQNSDI